MCGIFGMVRSTTATNPERASAAFIELGRLSVERGRDSAGFALANPDWTGTAITATRKHVEATKIRHNGVTIIKDTVEFGDLWNDADHLPLLAEHKIAFGHTRFATQGNRASNLNVSPLLVGSLVGTHNGDVDTVSVRGKWSLAKPMGGTDTEVLYKALDRDRKDRRSLVKTLTEVEGRAALAWLDREKPDRVYLSRAALSPLSTAYDAQGNFYWASNPRWFRDIDAMFDGAIGFHSITMVGEGHLLTIDAAAETPTVVDVRRFKPTCRASDARLSDRVVWRGFDDADITVDKAQVNHLVAKSWTPAYKPTKTKATTGTGSTMISAPAKVSGNVVDDPWYLDFVSQDQVDAVREHFGADWSRDADGFTPEEAEQWDKELAMEAYERWIDQGEDATVLGVIRNATMPSEKEQILDEFDLPNNNALTMFRTLLDAHLVTNAVPAL